MAEDRFGIVGRIVASAYQVESVVAEGGFGVVYRAHHGGFRAPVALKCLKVPQHLGPEAQTRFLERFRAEAEVMFRLSASLPTVVRPLHVDAMTAPNGSFVPFMVLEWLEGETLDSIIRGRTDAKKPPLGLAEVLDLLDPVARALDRAHHFSGPAGAEAIVHCDLKPENVFVATSAGERQVKILDFGVAEVQRAAKSEGVGTGSFALFTPAYGAPEQWRPKELGSTGPHTDVWGLALTIAEALAGRPLLAGDHAELMRMALDPKRPTPRNHGVATSDAVDAVFQRALAVRPQDRFPDAGSFWKALLAAHSRATDVAPARALEIPDLVPVSRRPSGVQKLELPSMHQLDFDADDHGPSLALDVSPDELVRRGSLAPVPAAGGSFDEPAPSTLSGTSLPASRGEPGPSRAPAPTPAAPLPSPAGIPPMAGPVAHDAAQRSSRPPSVPLAIPKSEPPPASLARRLAPGLGIAAGSIVVTLLDSAYAAATSEVFSVGPIKASTIAALLLVVGLGLAAREFFRQSS